METLRDARNAVQFGRRKLIIDSLRLLLPAGARDGTQSPSTIASSSMLL